MEQWLWADKWGGHVWLDGEDVTNRCAGVRLDGERPVEVELYVMDGKLARVNEARTDLVRERLSGDIRVDLKPRGMRA